MKKRKVALLILLGLTVFVLAAHLLGFTKRRIAVATDIKASPEKVWAVFSNFGDYESWKSPLRFKIPPTQTGQTIAFYFVKEDGKADITLEPVVLELESNRILRWKGQLFVPGIFDGEHSFLLEALPSGDTRFTQSENFSGVLILFSSSMLNETQRRFADFNEKLKVQVERS